MRDKLRRIVLIFSIFIIFIIGYIFLINLLSSSTQKETYCLEWGDLHGSNGFDRAFLESHCYNSSLGLYSCAWIENQTTHEIIVSGVVYSSVQYSNLTIAHINWTLNETYYCIKQVQLNQEIKQ